MKGAKRNRKGGRENSRKSKVESSVLGVKGNAGRVEGREERELPSRELDRSIIAKSNRGNRRFERLEGSKGGRVRDQHAESTRGCFPFRVHRSHAHADIHTHTHTHIFFRREPHTRGNLRNRQQPRELLLSDWTSDECLMRARVHRTSDTSVCSHFGNRIGNL